jgi:hypothetical protein
MGAFNPVFNCQAETSDLLTGGQCRRDNDQAYWDTGAIWGRALQKSVFLEPRSRRGVWILLQQHQAFPIVQLVVDRKFVGRALRSAAGPLEFERNVEVEQAGEARKPVEIPLFSPSLASASSSPTLVQARHPSRFDVQGPMSPCAINPLFSQRQVIADSGTLPAKSHRLV